MRTQSIVVVALACGAVLAGCSTAADAPGTAPTGGSTSSATSPSPTTSPAPIPATPTTPTTPTKRGASPSLVNRPGGLPAAQRISAAPAPYKKPVTYKDGLKVQVLKITQSTITAQGPGALTGKPMTTFTIQFTNNTTKPVDLNQVVVSAFYGNPAQQAEPVYENGVNDFTGMLAPGKVTSTSYAFSIPVDSLKAMTLAVDFDGTHTAAVFSGTA